MTSGDNLPISTSDVKQEVRIRMGKDGQSAISTKTVMLSFDDIVKSKGSKPALYQKAVVDGKVANTWTKWTWKEYRENADMFGKALLSLGFNRFDIINIIGFNRWVFGDSAVDVNIYKKINTKQLDGLNIFNSNPETVLNGSLRTSERLLPVGLPLEFTQPTMPRHVNTSLIIPKRKLWFVKASNSSRSITRSRRIWSQIFKPWSCTAQINSQMTWKLSALCPFTQSREVAFISSHYHLAHCSYS